MSRREAGASRPGREVIQQNHWSRIPPNNASNVTSRRRTRIMSILRTFPDPAYIREFGAGGAPLCRRCHLRVLFSTAHGELSKHGDYPWDASGCLRKLTSSAAASLALPRWPSPPPSLG